MHRLQELVRLHRLGIGCREVARRLRMSTRTENKYRSALREAGLIGDNYFCRSATITSAGRRHSLG